jgi:hypothetical protein
VRVKAQKAADIPLKDHETAKELQYHGYEVKRA